MKQAFRLAISAVILLLAAASGAPVAAQGYGTAVAAYERGDYATALRLFRTLADQGDASAQYDLGSMYENGEGVEQDYAEAAKWYRRAAEQGYAIAQNHLGIMHDSGVGVPQNYSEAARWYRRAAEQGHTFAQDALGYMYRIGRGVSQDYAEAVTWYRRAAEQGYVDAQLQIGIMYYHGEGISQNYIEASKWFRRAAKQGSVRAGYNLGNAYYFGKGVPQDYVEAAKWKEYAAEQGFARAQFDLGLQFYNGKGVPQDYSESVKWYYRAAEQGHAGAQNNLGVMYEEGYGVSRNLERAHMWFNLSASQVPATEDEGRQISVENRDRVAALLTPVQLARAQRMAREWQLSMDDPRLGPILDYDPFAPDIAATPPVPVPAPKPPALETISTGSGFRVSAEGHILTNAHVVKGCVEVQVLPAGPVAVAARDDAADLALLKGAPGEPFAFFRQGRGIRPGAGVVAVGFPLRGVLASGANVTTGNVAALAGPGDDRRLIQITAPVQRGNSGGPVLDMAGNAVGVVVSKLDAMKVARATGDIPQNVNFAVSAGATRAFLDSEGVAYTTAPSKDRRAPEEVAAAAKAFTVLIECLGEG